MPQALDCRAQGLLLRTGRAYNRWGTVSLLLPAYGPVCVWRSRNPCPYDAALHHAQSLRGHILDCVANVNFDGRWLASNAVDLTASPDCGGSQAVRNFGT